MTVFTAKTANDQYQCVSLNMPEKNISAGILLVGHGSVPPVDAAYQDNTVAITKGAVGALATAIQDCMESDGCGDISTVKTNVREAIAEYGKKMRHIRELTGQAVFLTGCIVYTVHDRVQFFSLGGIWGLGSAGDGTEPILILKTEGFNENALGCPKAGIEKTGRLQRGFILCSTHIAFQIPTELTKKTTLQKEDLDMLMALVEEQPHAMMLITP